MTLLIDYITSAILHVFKVYREQNRPVAEIWKLTRFCLHAAVLKEVLIPGIADAVAGTYLFSDRGYMALLDTSTDAWQTTVQICSQDTSFVSGTIWHGCWICSSSGNSRSVKLMHMYMILNLWSGFFTFLVGYNDKNKQECIV